MASSFCAVGTFGNEAIEDGSGDGKGNAAGADETDDSRDCTETLAVVDICGWIAIAIGVWATAGPSLDIGADNEVTSALCTAIIGAEVDTRGDDFAVVAESGTGVGC